MSWNRKHNHTMIILSILMITGLMLVSCAPVASRSGLVTVENYDNITLNNSDVTISDEDVNSMIEDMRQFYAEIRTEYDGKVEQGDQVTVTYEAYLDVDDRPFEGGASPEGGEEFIVGQSGSFPNYGNNLVGKEIGQEVELHLKFPVDYDDMDLAGQPVTYYVTVVSKQITVLRGTLG